MVWRLRASARGGFYSFGQMALRSARGRGRAGFFFKLVLALVARGRFFLLVKRLALRAGQRQSCFFSLSWFSKLVLAPMRGAVLSFGQMALRSARARDREGCFESPLPTSGPRGAQAV